MSTLFNQDPITVRELVMFAFESGETYNDKTMEEAAEEVHTLLVGKSRMLDEYFSFKIDSDGTISTIPLILGEIIGIKLS